MSPKYPISALPILPIGPAIDGDWCLDFGNF